MFSAYFCHIAFCTDDDSSTVASSRRASDNLNASLDNDDEYSNDFDESLAVSTVNIKKPAPSKMGGSSDDGDDGYDDEFDDEGAANASIASLRKTGAGAGAGGGGAAGGGGRINPLNAGRSPDAVTPQVDLGVGVGLSVGTGGRMGRGASRYDEAARASVSSTAGTTLAHEGLLDGGQGRDHPLGGSMGMGVGVGAGMDTVFLPSSSIELSNALLTSQVGAPVNPSGMECMFTTVFRCLFHVCRRSSGGNCSLCVKD